MAITVPFGGRPRSAALFFFLLTVFMVCSFAEAQCRPRGMVRQVKFVCADAGSVEAVGRAILAAHYNEEDVDTAARQVAQSLIDAGTCTHFAKHVDVLLQRVIKWLS